MFWGLEPKRGLLRPNVLDGVCLSATLRCRSVGPGTGTGTGTGNRAQRGPAVCWRLCPGVCLLARLKRTDPIRRVRVSDFEVCAARPVSGCRAASSPLFAGRRSRFLRTEMKPVDMYLPKTKSTPPSPARSPRPPDGRGGYEFDRQLHPVLGLGERGADGRGGTWARCVGFSRKVTRGFS